MSRIVDIEPLLKKYDGMNEGTEFSPIHFINDLMALEQQPCEDCISREQAVYVASGYCAPQNIADELRKLPSVTPKTGWIPCSERLPEDIKPVIVTWKNTDPKSYYQYIVGKHFIGTAHYCRGKWYWYSSVTEDMLAEYGKCITEEFDEAIEAVAWMPLPEPYKEDAE